MEYCEHCGASLKKYWHRLTPGMVRALIKANRFVASVKNNKFHLYNDLTEENKLTTVEQMNWTKLRFHGLVAKVKTNGDWERGYWLITRRGGQFLKSEISVPVQVQTFRNKVIGHSVEQVLIKDVIKNLPYFDKSFDFDYASEEDLENVPTVKRMKKTKNLCPKCGQAEMTKKFNAEPKDEKTYYTSTFRECPNCGFKDTIL